MVPGAPKPISYEFSFRLILSHVEGIEGKVFKYVAGCAGGICIDLSSSMSKQLKKVPSNDWQLLTLLLDQDLRRICEIY